MSTLWSCNEWDPLEEVIVGNPLRARFPTADRSTQLAEFPDRSLEEIPQGAFPQWIIEETEEDLNEFVAVLEKLGITVKRPETWPHEAQFSTIHWQSEGYYNYCPRDIMLVIGDHIIETPNVIRSRAQESMVQRTQANASGLAVRRRYGQAHAT
jgi:N-dimethylarginine dimethylaminohydrolase